MENSNHAVPKIFVVIPAYKVSNQIVEVVRSIGHEVSKIIVIDDACPDSSGKVLVDSIRDSRLEVIFHTLNTGVGGAVITGYKKAMQYDCDVVVKVDGDGQMDTARIINLIQPILDNRADYTKGNRFFEIDYVKQMPKIRILGNLGLSFMTKLSTGYWHIFDPNNGFTAIHKSILERLNLEKIDKGYFFESDMLFRLHLLGCRVLDIAIPARYGKEKSSLKIGKVLLEFPIKHTKNLLKRILYMYYLRDFKLASIELPLGIALSAFGILLGFYSWLNGILTNTATPTGTLVLIAMSSLAGLQLILAFFSYDTNNSIK